MRETRSSGSVRGASGDGRPYRERDQHRRPEIVLPASGYQRLDGRGREGNDRADRYPIAENHTLDIIGGAYGTTSSHMRLCDNGQKKTGRSFCIFLRCNAAG